MWQDFAVDDLFEDKSYLLHRIKILQEELDLTHGRLLACNISLVQYQLIFKFFGMFWEERKEEFYIVFKSSGIRESIFVSFVPTKQFIVQDGIEDQKMELKFVAFCPRSRKLGLFFQSEIYKFSVKSVENLKSKFWGINFFGVEIEGRNQ